MIRSLSRDPLFLAAVFGAVFVWAGLLHSSVAQYFEEVQVLQVPSSLFLLIVVSPILEELAFRGWLQGHLLKIAPMKLSLAGLTWSNILVSLLFAGLHGLIYSSPLYLLVFFPSLIFGFFRERYDSVLPGTVLHMYYNAGWIVALSL